MLVLCAPTHFAAHNLQWKNIYIFSTESATTNLGTFSSIIHFHSPFPSFTSTPIWIPPTTLKQNTLTGLAQCLLTPVPLLLSVTDLRLGKTATLKEKNVKALLSFSPLHILHAKLMLCSAISIQAADSQPGPLPSSVLARKSRLQRENVINSMEKKHRLSIIHVPLCCYLWLSLSPPTPSDLAAAGSLSPSHAICV